MQPEDTEALEAAAWDDFVHRLKAHLADQWPAMPERLGERYEAFVDAAVGHALQREWTSAGAIARLVNLWFVWGPAFHDKPGFEWAQGLLAAPAAQQWNTAHQLVRRSLAELQRLPIARIDPKALADADARVVDRFAPLGLKGAMRQADPEPLPRVACDLEHADLRVMDDGWHQEYRLAPGGDWQRTPAALPPPLRVDAAHPLPARLALLSQQAGQGREARLQVKLQPHAVCDVDVHPALAFLGPHGRWQWHGHETRGVNWACATRAQPLPPAGPGTLVADEGSPEFHQLSLQACGLRDEGDPLGTMETLVAVYPAEQWWLEVQRAQPQPQALLPGPRPWLRGSTRCRVERDGASQDSAPLKARFEEGLDADVAVGLQALGAAWEQLPGLAQPALQAQLALLAGKAAFTWGWRHGPGGLDGTALMRLVALLEMVACQCDLQFGGELALAATRTRVALAVAGQAPLRAEVRHETAAPLADVLMVAGRAEFRFPFTLALEPMAAEGAALLQAAGPVSGALVGDAGLRPNQHGGSGWEWFAALRVEPVAVPLQVNDPLLGEAHFVQPLLPALTLVDWSLG